MFRSTLLASPIEELLATANGRKRMKLRHATALALVGWYLMIPPSAKEKATLSKWQIAATYDAASACTEALRKNKDRAQAEYDHPSPPPSSWNHPTKEWPKYSRLIAEAFLSAQCIATDDPRLKGN